MGGQSFIGINLVRAPVNNDTTAIVTSIIAEPRKTITEVGFSISPNAVMNITNNPIKDKASPSMTHSIKRILLLSAEIGPKLPIMPFVGIAICATPQTTIIDELEYSNISFITWTLVQF